LLVEDEGAHGDLENEFVAGVAGAVGAFAVTAAIGLELSVVAIAQQRVVVGIGFDVNAAAVAAIASGRAAARNVLFAAESYAAVAAVAGFNEDLGFINEHERILGQAFQNGK